MIDELDIIELKSEQTSCKANIEDIFKEREWVFQNVRNAKFRSVSDYDDDDRLDYSYFTTFILELKLLNQYSAVITKLKDNTNLYNITISHDKKMYIVNESALLLVKNVLHNYDKLFNFGVVIKNTSEEVSKW